MQALRKVIIPEILPGMISGFMLAQPRLGKIEFYAIFSIRNSKLIIQRMTRTSSLS